MDVAEIGRRFNYKTAKYINESETFLANMESEYDTIQKKIQISQLFGDRDDKFSEAFKNTQNLLRAYDNSLKLDGQFYR